MNTELWNKVLAFDLDRPLSEYGFSTRLAKENYWSRNFTNAAILEYKKFMYLAATSDLMVSPSEIVDVVWHQHLIFTQSYSDFCEVLGKQIQHVPSTHNRAEYSRFMQAKDRTKKLYANSFGEQPSAIWNYSNMFESMNLDKARYKIRTIIIVGILAFLVLTIPAYYALRPLYIHINNPHFIIGLVVLTGLALAGLELFNRNKLRQIVYGFYRDSFVFNLHPLEMVYLKTQKVSNVINGVMNELIEKGRLRVNHDYTMERITESAAVTTEEFQVYDVFSRLGKAHYPLILKELVDKPVFWNTANSMDAFKKYFNKSRKFGAVFYVNFALLLMLLMLAIIRLSTGILRDLPVMQISLAVIALVVVIIWYLNRLTKLVCINTLPTIYKTKILPSMKTKNEWQWTYFLEGASVLTAAFVPVVNYVEKHRDSSGGCGTSCGSSCGSSCSSCGGCGGD